MSRACSDCGGRISRCSKGRCRPCASVAMRADPSYEARRIAGIRKRFKDPANRAKAAREIMRRHMEARKRPEVAAKLAKNLAIARERTHDPDVRAAYLATRPAAGKKRSATAMAWCPLDKRDEYARLVRTKRMPAAEARKTILDSLTPFEKQMHAISQGRGIVTRQTLSKSYDFTLGGGSPL
jgi:hypothetical protein